MPDRDGELLLRIMQEDSRRQHTHVGVGGEVLRFLIWMPILSCVAYGIIGALFAPADVQTLLANFLPAPADVHTLLANVKP